MTDSILVIQDSVFNRSVHHFGDSMITVQINLVHSNLPESNPILGLSPDLARILIPVLVTLLVFLLGIIVNYFFKKYERISTLQSIKSVILIWGKLLHKSVSQQSNSCRDLNTRLQKSLIMQPERFQFNIILTSKIRSLELRDLIDTVIVNQRGEQDEKSKYLFNWVSQIEFLDLCKSELKSKYEAYHKDALMYMDQWNEAYRRLNNIYTDLRIKLQTEPSDPAYPFYQEIARTFNDFVNNNPSGGNMDIFKNGLFTPIISICQKYAISNPDRQEVYNISLAVQDLIIIMKKWDANRVGTGELFNDFANRIDSTYKVLEESISKIEKMKFKWIFKIQ